MEIKTLEEIVKKRLSEKRFYHSVCVKERCRELAEQYGVDVTKAELVGIAHDIAKEMNEDEQNKFIEENNLEIDSIEKENRGLLHAKIGAKICENEFNFSKDMVEAVKYHTTGKENMDMLAKILFIADATGKDRKWSDLQYAVDLSKKDIDETMLYILNLNIKDIVDKNKIMHIDAVKARNEYILLFELK